MPILTSEQIETLEKQARIFRCAIDVSPPVNEIKLVMAHDEVWEVIHALEALVSIAKNAITVTETDEEFHTFYEAMHLPVPHIEERKPDLSEKQQAEVLDWVHSLTKDQPKRSGPIC